MLSPYQQLQLAIMNLAIENQFLFGDYFAMKINRKNKTRKANLIHQKSDQAIYL
jgi:predicted component of type VI protein secretion system